MDKFVTELNWLFDDINLIIELYQYYKRSPISNKKLIFELASNGQIQSIIKICENLEVDINVCTYTGTCAVVEAVRRNDLEMLKLLVYYNGNLNVTDSVGRKILDHAVARKFYEIIDYLKLN